MSWKCPDCGCVELTVSGVCEAYVIQTPDGSRPNLVPVGGIEFDLTSLMTCTECSYCDAAASFECPVKPQRPAAPDLSGKTMIGVGLAGIKAGLFFDTHGSVRTIQHAEADSEILISTEAVDGFRWLKVTEGDQPGYFTEFYATAKDIEGYIGDSGALESLIDLPGALAMPDAMRIAKSYHSSESDLETLRQALAVTAISLHQDGDLTGQGIALDEDANTNGILRITLNGYVERPTLVTCFYETWVWSGNTHYDDEAPDGVNDIRELESFKRARKYAESLGYEVEFIQA